MKSAAGPITGRILNDDYYNEDMKKINTKSNIIADDDSHASSSLSSNFEGQAETTDTYDEQGNHDVPVNAVAIDKNESMDGDNNYDTMTILPQILIEYDVIDPYSMYKICRVGNKTGNDSDADMASNEQKIKGSDVLVKQEAEFLFVMFNKFCTPHPSLIQLEDCIRYCQCLLSDSTITMDHVHNCHLPRDVVVNPSGCHSVIKMLNPDCILNRRLSDERKTFQLAFLYTLLRLLLNEDKREFEESMAVVLSLNVDSSKGNSDYNEFNWIMSDYDDYEINHQTKRRSSYQQESQPLSSRRLKQTPIKCNSSIGVIHKASSSDSLYSVIRFLSCDQWKLSLALSEKELQRDGVHRKGSYGIDLMLRVCMELLQIPDMKEKIDSKLLTSFSEIDNTMELSWNSFSRSENIQDNNGTLSQAPKKKKIQFKSVEEREMERKRTSHLIAPMMQLLSVIVSSGCICVHQFRWIIDMLALPQSSGKDLNQDSIGLITRLHLIHALTNASDGRRIRFNDVHSKAAPRRIFTFSSIGGNGIVTHYEHKKNITGTVDNPGEENGESLFSEEYGFCAWFRAEQFLLPGREKVKTGSNPNPILFSLKNYESNESYLQDKYRGGVEVSLETLPQFNGQAVATLVVTVLDPDSREQRSVKMSCCVISPKVWHHVAVKHSRHRTKGFKNFFARASNGDELVILLDGRPLLRTNLKYPKIASSSKGDHANVSSEYKIEIGRSFDGQFGAFFVFKSGVTEEALQCMMERTSYVQSSRNAESSQNGTKNNIQWKADKAAYARESNTLKPEHIRATEFDERTVTENSILSSRFSDLKSYSLLAATAKLSLLSDINDAVLGSADTSGDLGEYLVLSNQNDPIPNGLQSFLIWDPTRCKYSIDTDLVLVIDPFSGCHGKMISTGIQPWSIEDGKDLIGSIGGIQVLLPFWRKDTLVIKNDLNKYSPKLNGFEEIVYMVDSIEPDTSLRNTMLPPTHERLSIIPSLLLTVASYLRDNDRNIREFLRCNGIDVIADSFQCIKHTSEMRKIRTFPNIARPFVNALLEIRKAASINLTLESIVLKRLLFNTSLWFDGISYDGGVALHAALMPELSSFAKAEPNQIRDSVGIEVILAALNEFTAIDDKKQVNREPASCLFDRSLQSQLPYDASLSLYERRHLVDMVIGMTVALMAPNVSPDDLQSLLNYISFNIEYEAITAKKQQALPSFKTDLSVQTRTGSRQEKYLATTKACKILLFLIQSRPFIPGLYDALETCTSNSESNGGKMQSNLNNGGDCVMAWFLSGIINCPDDFLRSLGIRCLTQYMDGCIGNRYTSVSYKTSESHLTANALMRTIKEDKQAEGSMRGVSLMNSVRTNLGRSTSTTGDTRMANNIPTPNAGILLSRRLALNERVSLKFLWHILKAQRNTLNKHTHAALIHLFVKTSEEDPMESSVSTSHQRDQIIIPDTIFPGGYILNNSWAQLHLGEFGYTCMMRSEKCTQLIFRILRYLHMAMQERWLFDILALIRANPESLIVITDKRDWQSSLFGLLSEILEENAANVQNVNKLDGSQDPIDTRFDLSAKLCSTLLSHCMRQGGDVAIKTLEQIAALQNSCVNGNSVFRIILSHVLCDMIDNGTIPNISHSMRDPGLTSRNAALKESARIVTSSVGSNGNIEMDFQTAVKQWRFLRHLTAIVVCVISKSGYGVVDCLSESNQRVNKEPYQWSKLNQFGRIWLENSPRGLNPTSSALNACVTLASGILTLLDAFIFPDEDALSQNTDAMVYGLALVKPVEKQIANSQGPMLASLLRMSILLILKLDPCSLKFREACSRLRCCFHWSLEVIRETCVVGGYTTAFHKLTAILDRLVLSVIIAAHRSLFLMYQVLNTVKNKNNEQVISTTEEINRKKRRLILSAMDLREIILEAFRRRSEVLREALSLEAFEALQAGLEDNTGVKRRANLPEISWQAKEENIMNFMKNSWVQQFQDETLIDGVCIPSMVSSGQEYKNRNASTRGKDVIFDLVTENKEIVSEYENILNSSFDEYLQDQRSWGSDTKEIRNLESTGDAIAKSMQSKYRLDLQVLTQSTKLVSESSNASVKIVDKVLRMQWSPWFPAYSHKNITLHYKFSDYPDPLFRRIVLTQNHKFDDHENHRYDKSMDDTKVESTKIDEIVTERLSSLGAFRQDYFEYAGEDEECDSGGESDVQDEDKAETHGEANNSGQRPRRIGSIRDAIYDYSVEKTAELIDIDESRENSNDKQISEALNNVGDIRIHKLMEKESERPDYQLHRTNDDFKSTGQNDNDTYWELVQIHESDSGSASIITSSEKKFSWSHKYFKWEKNERVVSYSEAVVLIKLRFAVEGEILLTTHSIYFRQTKDPISVMSGTFSTNENDDKIEHSYDSSPIDRWKLSRLSEMLGRRCFMRSQGLELFFVDNKSLLINFLGGMSERNNMYANIRSICKTPLLRAFHTTATEKRKPLTPRQIFKRGTLTKLWQNRLISNFDYLMHLNILAGRSFNDIAQYPVFPWILIDYKSETIDLNDPSIYRDLSKPVGALNPERLKILIERFNDLDGFVEERFLYGSHYSSPGVVLHYLIRQEPFTSMAVELQSGRFDVPDRLFFDLAQCWHGCMNSTTDVKELVPEFFTSPEIFKNTNSFPLGKMQDGRVIDDVVLPPWAKGSAEKFVQIHRAALESEYVTQNLHKWIDLIFGYQQRGQAAIEAHNVFHPLSYEGAVDMDQIDDEVDRLATEAHIQNFGQTPSQLITKDPHPHCLQVVQCWAPLCRKVTNFNFSSLNSYRPPGQYGGKRTRHGQILNIHVVSDTVYAVHSNLVIATYKWAPKTQGIFPFSWKNDKRKQLCAPTATRIFLPECELGREASDKLDIFNRKSSKDCKMPTYLYRYDGNSNQFSVGLIANNSNVLSSSSAYLVSSGYFDDSIKLHSLDGLKLRCEASVTSGNGQVTCLAVDDVDHTIIATGATDGTCRVWAVNNSHIASALADTYVQTLQGCTASEMAKTNDYGVSSKSNSETIDMLHILWGHNTPISCIVLNSDLDLIVSGSVGGLLCIHSMRTGTFIRCINFDHSIRCLAISQSDGTIIIHLTDGQLISCTPNGVVLAAIPSADSIICMEIAMQQQNILLTGGEAGILCFRSIHNLELKHSIDISYHGPVQSLALSKPDDQNLADTASQQFLFVGSDDGVVSIIASSA